jgi:outer membrane protein assembly factor BamB
MLPTGGPIAASPILDPAGVVYLGSQDDRLYAVTGAGHVRWSVEFPTDIDSAVTISSGGTIVVGSDDGHLRGLR